MRANPILALAVGAASLLGGGETGAEEAADLRRLFQQEADVLTERDGLSRLVLPPEVLAVCLPDLSDLRVFDAADLEVPFLIDGRTVQPTALELSQRFDPPVLEARRQEIKRRGRPSIRRETFELGLPGEAPASGNWVLLVETRRPEFVARVDVEGISAAGDVVRLIENESLFRLRGPRPAEKLRVSPPAFSGGRLRVVIETERSFWLEPSFRLEAGKRLGVTGLAAIALEAVSTSRVNGKTVIDLARPRGVVPFALRVETTTGTFDRRVEIWDEGPGSGSGILGSGNVFRVEALVPAGSQEIEVGPAFGERLRVEIDDGDSPPLEALRFSALTRQPSLVFSLPAASEGRPAGTLRFGAGRAHRPRYDLAGLLPSPRRTATGERAEVAALLYDPKVVGTARLGTVRSNPLYDGKPALAFAMRPGSRIDRRIFSHRRPLRVPAAAEGLSRLELEPADVAALNDALTDLRVADGQSRQWPYLLERRAAVGLVSLGVRSSSPGDGTSRIGLELPVAPLRIERLLVDAEAAFFDRAFRLEAKIEGEKESRVVATGRLRRPIGDPRPVSVTLEAARVRSLELFVEDGDDAPLALRSVRAEVDLPALYMTAPEGEYSLLLGAPEQAAPRYELERVRDVVLAVRAAPIESDGLDENPDFAISARLRGKGLQQSVLLWVALIVAVIVLTALTLRLARRPSSDGAG